MVKDLRWFVMRTVRLIFPFGIILIVGSYITWTYFLITNRQIIDSPSRQQRSLKRILLWNSPHRLEAAAFGTGHRAFLEAKCPVSDCLIVANSSNFWDRLVQSNFRLLEKFDAVLFSVHVLEISPLPPPSYHRPSHQRYVLFTQESPESMVTFWPEDFDNFFNWTMSYRRDSDIQLLYGRISNSVKTSAKFDYSIRKKKKRKVAWMVSHCKTPSNREEYVRQLQEYIHVDVYGECGTLKCSRNVSHHLSHPKCYEKLAHEYKFYLAFENSLCVDYVSEKFFESLKYGLLPIVLGGADYPSFAPPHSYIDAKSFSSPAELATYLLKLDKDDKLYHRYFDWKSQFAVEAGTVQMSRHAFCDLCAKLHEPKDDKFYKIYDSLIPQWSPELQCHQFVTSRYK